MTGRPYEQRVRAESAAETRERILDALYERLRESPAGPVSVDEIARIGRVARSTVYLVFGSRSGLFDALTARLLEGAGGERIDEAVKHEDARETLRGGITGGVQMFAANHDVFRVLSSTAKLDPDGAGRALAAAEDRRRASMDWLGGRLAEQGVLRPGLTREHAADVLWILASFDAYDLLATGRGLSPEATAETLVRTAEHALLG
jgi:AcrR family transcriptional regulator